MHKLMRLSSHNTTIHVPVCSTLNWSAQSKKWRKDRHKATTYLPKPGDDFSRAVSFSRNQQRCILLKSWQRKNTRSLFSRLELEYEPSSSQRLMPLPSHLNAHFFSEVLRIMSCWDKVPFIFWKQTFSVNQLLSCFRNCSISKVARKTEGATVALSFFPSSSISSLSLFCRSILFFR